MKTKEEQLLAKLGKRGVDPKDFDLFISAAKSRYAWKSGLLDENEDITALAKFHYVAFNESGFGWVDNKGTIYYCDFACHDQFALIFLGKSVEEVEKKFARVTMTTYSVEAAIEHVEKPSKKMIEAVEALIYGRPHNAT